MGLYRVVWTLFVDADSTEEARQIAFEELDDAKMVITNTARGSAEPEEKQF